MPRRAWARALAADLAQPQLSVTLAELDRIPDGSLNDVWQGVVTLAALDVPDAPRPRRRPLWPLPRRRCSTPGPLHEPSG